VKKLFSSVRWILLLLGTIGLLGSGLPAHAALGGDLGDGFYIHNVDPYSDIISVTVSSEKMNSLLNGVNNLDFRV
jgi:hypothetical protein